MKSLLLIALAVVCFRCDLANAQSVETGKLTGVIVDRYDAAILNSKITVKGKGQHLKLTPNSDGCFDVELPAGEYDIKVDAYQFRTLHKKKIRVSVGSRTEQKLTLEVLPTKYKKCPQGALCL